MSEEMVRILTKFQGLEFRTVPISQVPAGYILIHIRDHGQFYADPAGLRSSGPVHPPFSDATRAELQKQYDLFTHAGIEYVIERTLDMWVDGFRPDRTPWKEMALWDLMAAALEKFSSHIRGDDELSISKQNDVFRVLLSVVNNAAQVRAGFRFQPFNSLSGNRVGEIVEWMQSDEANAIKQQALKKYRTLLRERIIESLPDRVGYHSLFTEDMHPNPDSSFDVIEFLATADIIMAEDVNMREKRCVVLGEKRYEELIASAVDGSVNVVGARLVFIELDMDTDELERLCGVIRKVKGS
jgi:hypothetical protein